nr:putative reverse transcriptase, RNA-dependent DNA polymerase, Gag-polypeptide of LTR copia-type [Tanacetum cinerariifolium]
VKLTSAHNYKMWFTAMKIALKDCWWICWVTIEKFMWFGIGVLLVVVVISVKLTSAHNYKMWSTAMKIALKGKNKMGFVDGSCVRPVTSVVLAQQWEKCNAIVLG